MEEKVVIGTRNCGTGTAARCCRCCQSMTFIYGSSYGISRDGKPPSTSSHRGHKGYEFMGWDADAPPAWLFGLMHEKAANLIIWGANYYPRGTCGPAWAGWCVGQGQRISQSDQELAYSTLDKALRSMTLNRAANCAGRRGAPDAKARAGDGVVPRLCSGGGDGARSFAGSGTTGVACAQLGKAFTGIERERRYFDIATSALPRQAQGRLLPPEELRQPVQKGCCET